MKNQKSFSGTVKSVLLIIGLLITFVVAGVIIVFIGTTIGTTIWPLITALWRWLFPIVLRHKTELIVGICIGVAAFTYFMFAVSRDNEDTAYVTTKTKK